MRHVIVGAGPAALAAMETIRALDGAADISLVCDEPPYARMVLPYYVSGQVGEASLMTGSDAWFADLGVTTRFGQRVVSLEPERDAIQLDDGSSLEFDRLLLATGSRSRRPPIPGADDPGVLSMWTLSDAREFLAAPRRRVVIVGAGFIAFTTLDAIASRAEQVSFVEMESRVLPRMLDASASDLVEKYLANRGIECHTSVGVERIESRGERRRLHLSDNKSIECETVVLATGIQPNVDFLEGSGVEIGHAIRVDDRMCSSRSGVYAAGDVAEGPDLLGGPRRVQAIQPTAVDHGRVAGANMAGLDVRYSGSLTMNILAMQGIEACSFGCWEREEHLTRVADRAGPAYRKYVWDDDRLVGGILVGPGAAVSGLNDVGMLKGLIQSQVRLGAWRSYLERNPLDLRRPYVASGAARQLLGTTLLAGRASGGGGFRTPALPPLRGRSPHHGTLLSGFDR